MLSVFAAALASGCAGSVGYSATVSNEGYGPDLVYAAPGVQVIADYDEPIFFVDGFYWRNDGGGWYRSTYYTGGWSAYGSPPSAIVRIDRPRDYVHYRPQGWTPQRHDARGPVVVRDQRRAEPQRAPARQEPPRRAEPPARQEPPRRAEPPARSNPSHPAPAPARGRNDSGHKDHR